MTGAGSGTRSVFDPALGLLVANTVAIGANNVLPRNVQPSNLLAVAAGWV